MIGGANRWTDWVKAFARDHNTTYSCALSTPECKEQYRAKYGTRKRLPQKKEREMMGMEDVNVAEKVNPEIEMMKMHDKNVAETKQERFNKKKKDMKHKLNRALTATAVKKAVAHRAENISMGEEDIKSALLRKMLPVVEHEGQVEEAVVDVPAGKKKGRPKKYATAEEARKAKIQMTMESAKRRKQEKRIAKEEAKFEKARDEYDAIKASLASKFGEDWKKSARENPAIAEEFNDRMGKVLKKAKISSDDFTAYIKRKKTGGSESGSDDELSEIFGRMNVAPAPIGMPRPISVAPVAPANIARPVAVRPSRRNKRKETEEASAPAKKEKKEAKGRGRPKTATAVQSFSNAPIPPAVAMGKMGTSKVNGGVRDKKLFKDYADMVNHLVGHITNPRDELDPRDYKQAVHLINRIQTLRGGVALYPHANPYGKHGGSFFGNIGNAFSKTWNQKPTSQERDVLDAFYNGFLPVATLPIKALAPPVGVVADKAFNALKQHQLGGVALYPHANPYGRHGGTRNEDGYEYDPNLSRDENRERRYEHYEQFIPPTPPFELTPEERDASRLASIETNIADSGFENPAEHPQFQEGMDIHRRMAERAEARRHAEELARLERRQRRHRSSRPPVRPAGWNSDDDEDEMYQSNGRWYIIQKGGDKEVKMG